MKILGMVAPNDPAIEVVPPTELQPLTSTLKLIGVEQRPPVPPTFQFEGKACYFDQDCAEAHGVLMPEAFYCAKPDRYWYRAPGKQIWDGPLKADALAMLLSKDMGLSNRYPTIKRACTWTVAAWMVNRIRDERWMPDYPDWRELTNRS